MFQLGRGVCQVDPLSPFLFILCLEVISRLLARSIDLGIIHGVPIAWGAQLVSHLMFADNLILFCRANCREARELATILRCYCSWSGQAINFQKSSIAFSGNTHPQLKAPILAKMNLKEIRAGNSYLGLPLFLPRSRWKAFRKLK